MKCLEIQDLLSSYYDEELASDLHSQVSSHLDQCLSCTKELAKFENLTIIVSAPIASVPSKQIWDQIEQQLDEPSISEHSHISTMTHQRKSPFASSKILALAATILVAVGMGWFSYHSWFMHHEHDQFTADFGHYLEEFRRDPDLAHQTLFAQYENQLVDPDQVIQQVGYRPAIAAGLPAGYTVESTHVMKMPCCSCMHSTCKRKDGSKFAIFEYDEDKCKEEHCCLSEIENPIVAKWTQGTRHITLIGLRDKNEASDMIAWLDERNSQVHN